jgi:hypothetical protein
MKKTDLIIGLLIGLLTAMLGTFLFLVIFTNFNSINDFKIMKQQGILGKVITLGTILNIVVFFILLQKKKEMMARGIVLSMIVLTLFTLFI